MSRLGRKAQLSGRYRLPDPEELTKLLPELLLAGERLVRTFKVDLSGEDVLQEAIAFAYRPDKLPASVPLVAFLKQVMKRIASNRARQMKSQKTNPAAEPGSEPLPESWASVSWGWRGGLSPEQALLAAERDALGPELKAGLLDVLYEMASEGDDEDVFSMLEALEKGHAKRAHVAEHAGLDKGAYDNAKRRLATMMTKIPDDLRQEIAEFLRGSV